MKPTVIIIAIAAAIASMTIAAFLGGIGRQSQWGQADPRNTRQVALGEQVYRDHCAACHGADLEGQLEWQTRRPDGRLPAPPHDESGHTWHHSDEILFRITKYGVSALVPGYESDMPAYAAVLTDEEIWSVLAFIKSRWPSAIQARHAEINRRNEQSR
jgi:mono/diheme cytochrome c family protein